MMTVHREQGETRQQILLLLRRKGPMTAAELSEDLGIGAVGVRQHLALLERDGLVYTSGVRRAVGRPSHLYALTEAAEALFPKAYDHLLIDALDFVRTQGGEGAIEQLFEARRKRLYAEYAPRLAGRSLPERVAELAAILNEHGYMCEWRRLPDGAIELIEHNCPIDCAARAYPQACAHERALYEDLLRVPVERQQTIAVDGRCCRFRIAGES
ncbi:MAG: metalloregulator ArsR/SmtB family transcription factor [Roseiflexaceae bacterium]|nr:transcriptional regulator [Roseiflexus sp.]MDW8213394.1 metalloregulator ArsR/SmtB family transcription factor [Roseiflexaceae bacterium]